MDTRPTPAQHPARPPERSLFALAKQAFRNAFRFEPEDESVREVEERVQRRLNRRERLGALSRWVRKQRELMRLAFLRTRDYRELSPAEAGTPNKINFRRSDPRHPMYDTLRMRGWVSVHMPGAMPQFAKDGRVVNAAEAFRAERLRVPACLAA